MKIGDIIGSLNYGDFQVMNILKGYKAEIRFLKTGYTTVKKLSNVREGKVRDPFFPNVYGKGFLGNSISTEEGEKKKSYRSWNNMMTRCYSAKYPSYQDVEVCKEWLNYSNFEKWFDCNYREGYDLDKDLLEIGNKVYAPDKCMFIPHEINCLICKPHEDILRGVCWSKEKSKYKCYVNGRHISYTDTKEEAFILYKRYKESEVKNVATKFFEQGIISDKLFNSLICWRCSFDFNTEQSKNNV